MRLEPRWSWLLPLVLCLSQGNAAALDPKQVFSTVAGQTANGDAAAVTPLTAREIPARADADEQFAADVLARLERQGETEALATRIETLASGVATLGRRMRDADLARMPVTRLESLQRNWRFYRRQLEVLQREAERQLDDYSADAAELASRRVTWLATRKQAEAIEVAPALLKRVDDVLARIEAADRALGEPLARQLELGRRANGVAASIEAGLRSVDAASTSFDFRLAVRDSAPLWVAWGDPRYSADAVSAATSAVELERDFLRRYLDASRDTAPGARGLCRAPAPGPALAATPEPGVDRGESGDAFVDPGADAPGVRMARAGPRRDDFLPARLADPAARSGAARRRDPRAAPAAEGDFRHPGPVALCRHGALRTAAARLSVRGAAAMAPDAPARRHPAHARRAGVDRPAGSGDADPPRSSVPSSGRPDWWDRWG